MSNVNVQLYKAFNLSQFCKSPVKAEPLSVLLYLFELRFFRGVRCAVCLVEFCVSAQVVSAAGQ